MINLLDEEHLLPRDNDPELESSIVEVRQSAKVLYRASIYMITGMMISGELACFSHM